MTSPTPATKPSTAELIRPSAIDLFFEHGYEATSLRAIAGEVGIQVGSLYNHLTSKESLLYSIMSTIMEDLLREFDARLESGRPTASSGSAPPSRSTSSSTRRVPARCSSATPSCAASRAAHRRKVVKLRDQYEERFVEIIEQGVADGSFEAPTRSWPPGRSSPSARARRRGSVPTVACNSTTSPPCTPISCSTDWPPVVPRRLADRAAVTPQTHRLRHVGAFCEALRANVR